MLIFERERCKLSPRFRFFFYVLFGCVRCEDISRKLKILRFAKRIWKCDVR